MSNPSVSVLIPSYNRAHLIQTTIEAVLNQTYSNCHVVLVDDGSTDATKARIAELYDGNDRVRYFRKPNGGVSSARNFGLEKVTGDYVAFLDSDDVWEPWKLEIQVACMEALKPHGVGMIWTDMDKVDANGTLRKARAMRGSYEVYAHYAVETIFPQRAALAALCPGVADPAAGTQVFWGDVFSYIALGNLCLPSTVLMTRERVQRIGGFNETMISGEDHEYHLKACRDGPSAFLDIASVRYRTGAEDQLTHASYTVVMAQNYIRTIEPVLRTERARIHLPAATLEKTLASAHAWVGSAMLEEGNHAGARREFYRSVRIWPWNLRRWAMLSAACLPVAGFNALRGGYRWIKRRRTGEPGA